MLYWFPQGSVISPRLFNGYVNDVEDSIPNSQAVGTCKYADDCTLNESVKEGDAADGDAAEGDAADATIKLRGPQLHADMG